MGHRWGSGMVGAGTGRMLFQDLKFLCRLCGCEKRESLRKKNLSLLDISLQSHL